MSKQILEKRQSRVRSALAGLEDIAAELDESKFVEIQGAVDKLTNTNMADKAEADAALSSLLPTAQGEKARAYYQLFKNLEGFEDAVEAALSVPECGDLKERLDKFKPGKRPGRKFVGIMTAIQALARPLLANETR